MSKVRASIRTTSSHDTALPTQILTLSTVSKTALIAFLTGILRIKFLIGGVWVREAPLWEPPSNIVSACRYSTYLMRLGLG